MSKPRHLPSTPAEVKMEVVGRILVLEENPQRIAELKLALEEPGHELISLPNFYNALDYLQENTVHLVMCDVHLASASGFEFLKALRSNQRLQQIPFVFYCINPSQLTKSFMHGLRVAALKLGADGVIVMENFDAERLCREVEQHLPPAVPRKCA